MEELQQDINLLFWLTGINGAPILLAKFAGRRFDYPVDGHQTFIDGRPILGTSKTWRGFIVAILTGIAIGSLFEFSLTLSLAFGSLSMLGDMTSSFIKRRLGLNASAMALGLDQIPEALFPLSGCQNWLGITNEQIVWIVLIFFCLELILSRILFWLKVRSTPY